VASILSGVQKMVELRQTYLFCGSLSSWAEAFEASGEQDRDGGALGICSIQPHHGPPLYGAHACVPKRGANDRPDETLRRAGTNDENEWSRFFLYLALVGRGGQCPPYSSPGFRRVGGPADRFSVSRVRNLDTVLFSD
jgi:hypothetical protein